MKKNMICIECPRGCHISANVEGNKIVEIKGAGCPKGILYATSEIEDPVRAFTTTVLAKGLPLKFIPVRTVKPIPKRDLPKAVARAREICITHPVRTGGVIVEDFLGLGTALIATRSVRL